MNALLKKHSVLQEVKSYVIIAFGLIIYSFAWTALYMPAEIVGGGASGMGLLIYYATGGLNGGIPLGYSYLVINAILLGFGFWIIGPRFGAKTIFAIAFNSLVLLIMQKYIPADLMGLQNDKLLSAILGGAIAGAGVGICLQQGGSSGGTDILAMIINKFYNVSLGKLIVLIDVVTVGCSYFIFHDIPTIIYGYVTMGVLGYAIDMVLSGDKQSSQIMVFSPKYREIGNELIEATGRSVSYIEGVGGYTNKPQKIVMMICRKGEQGEVFRTIKSVDPDAFITVASVMGVFGRGFEALRIK